MICKVALRVCPPEIDALLVIGFMLLTAFSAAVEQAGPGHESVKPSRALPAVVAQAFLPAAGSLDFGVVRQQSGSAASSSRRISFSRLDINPGLSLGGELITGDLNGDGKLDFVVATHSAKEPMGIYVLLGNGDGTYTMPSRVFSGCCSGVAVADMNGDGKLDLMFSSSGIWVLLGNGDGTFRSDRPVESPGIASPTPPVLGDFNGDGKLDVALAGQDGGIAVALGNGDGTLGAFTVFPIIGAFAQGFVAADFNGDGKLDLAATAPGTPPGYQDSVVGVLQGNGDGTFGSPTVFPVGSYGAGLVAADFNGDHVTDLAVTDYLSSSVSVLIGRGDGTFLPKRDFPADPNPDEIVAADFDGDGKLDLAVGAGPPELSILPGNGDGTFGPQQHFPAAGLLGPNMVVGDFNLDGKPDVGFTNPLIGILSIYLNTTGASVSTTTTLATSLNPSVFGQEVTFTAAVSSASGTPDGPVVFSDASTTFGIGSLVNGVATLSVSSVAAGSHSATARYQGNANFAPSTSTALNQTVSIAPTTSALTSSLNPAGDNQPVTFTSTVASQFGGPVTGSAAFFSGSQLLGMAPLNGNRAALTTSFPGVGTYPISAKYNGDGNNAGSTSATVRQVILASTTTTAISSLNPSFVGQAVTFTASVSSSAGPPPNGEILMFRNGSAVLAAVPLSGGMASMTTSGLPAGTLTITASYAGDAKFTGSTSPGLRQIVNATNKFLTTTLLVSSLNPSVYGQKVSWTATVTSSGSSIPTGRVSFIANGYSFGASLLNAHGVATLSRSLVNAGPYPMSAVYRGDTSNEVSQSTVLNQVIQATTSSAQIASTLYPSTQGQTVTFTATITSPTVRPTGPVTFKAGKTVLGMAQLNTGKATLTTSMLPLGTTKVTVVYYGDSNISGSSASVTQTVQP